MSAIKDLKRITHNNFNSSPEYDRPGIIYDPEYDQPETVNFCSKRRLTCNPKKISNIENSQLFRLRAVKPHSTFCICERYIAGQNSVKL